MTTLSCPPPEGGPRPTQGGVASSGRGVALIGVGALASLFLAACGGDHDSPPPSPPPAPMTQVPSSAAANDAALESFAFNLAQTDNTEPLTLELVPTLPTSETEEPIATP